VPPRRRPAGAVGAAGAEAAAEAGGPPRATSSRGQAAEESLEMVLKLVPCVSSDRRAQPCPRQTYLGDDLRLIFDPHGGRLDELSVPYACQQLPSGLSAQPQLVVARSVSIGGDHLAAGSRPQGPPDRHGDRLLDGAGRAVSQQHVDYSRVAA